MEQSLGTLAMESSWAQCYQMVGGVWTDPTHDPGFSLCIRPGVIF